MEHYDATVIGSGPAGAGAAMMATKGGKRVAVIERHSEVGGACTRCGTIANKALCHAVNTPRDARRDPLLRSLRTSLQLEFPPLLAAAGSVMRPRLPVAGVPRVRVSDTVLHYSASPFAVTIFGGGVIGCEYASIFLNLGCKVTLVNTRKRLLSFLDDEIAEALSCHLHEQGCVIRHNEKYAGLEARADDVVLLLESGRRIKSDLLLWANGRVGNSDTMNIEAAGVTVTRRGHTTRPVGQWHLHATGNFPSRPH